MVTLDEGRAALGRGRPVVLVTPPAPERAGAVWELAGTPLLIVCADEGTALAWAEAAPASRRVHVVTGLARTARLLKDHPPDVLVGTLDQLAALLARSALRCDAVSTVVIAWPESLVASEQASALDTLLAAVPDARRIVLSWNPAALNDFLERHARRAEMIGSLPLAPVGPARYAVAAPSRRPAALRDALDLLDPKRPLVWRGAAPPLDTAAPPPPDLVFCVCLPTRDELAALVQLGPVLVFVTGSQLAYLASIAAPLAALRLASAADRAQDRVEALRARIATEIDSRQHDAELALLDPLLERYDAAEVAAALLAISPQPSAISPEQLPAPAGQWVKVFVNVGKKDRASAKDLVGALIREVGLAKADLGRIDVRDTFSVVDVAAGVAERVVRELTGVTIRGRRALARLDRYS